MSRKIQQLLRRAAAWGAVATLLGAGELAIAGHHAHQGPRLCVPCGPCYGYYPTLWQRWPVECITDCAPETPLFFHELEDVPTPSNSPMPEGVPLPSGQRPGANGRARTVRRPIVLPDGRRVVPPPATPSTTPPAAVPRVATRPAPGPLKSPAKPAAPPVAPAPVAPTPPSAASPAPTEALPAPPIPTPQPPTPQGANSVPAETPVPQATPAEPATPAASEPLARSAVRGRLLHPPVQPADSAAAPARAARIAGRRPTPLAAAAPVPPARVVPTGLMRTGNPTLVQTLRQLQQSPARPEFGPQPTRLPAVETASAVFEQQRPPVPLERLPASLP